MNSVRCLGCISTDICWITRINTDIDDCYKVTRSVLVEAYFGTSTPSVNLCMCVYVSVCVCVCVCLSVYLLIYTHTHTRIRLSALPVCLSVCHFICPSTCLLDCLSVFDMI